MSLRLIVDIINYPIYQLCVVYYVRNSGSGISERPDDNSDENFPDAVSDINIDNVISYLGVDPLMGFSIAFFIMILDMVDMTIQMNTNLIQTFLADITRGIIHIPSNVQI